MMCWLPWLYGEAVSYGRCYNQLHLMLGQMTIVTGSDTLVGDYPSDFLCQSDQS